MDSAVGFDCSGPIVIAALKISLPGDGPVLDRDMDAELRFPAAAFYRSGIVQAVGVHRAGLAGAVEIGSDDRAKRAAVAVFLEIAGITGPGVAGISLDHAFARILQHLLLVGPVFLRRRLLAGRCRARKQ